MKSSEVIVKFEARSAASLPKIGHIKAIRVNGHVEKMRVSEVTCKERWIERQWSEGAFPLYVGEITYHRA